MSDPIDIEDLRAIKVDPGLAAALVQASAEVEAVAKRGKNPQLGGKSYATADDINAVARQALSGAGAAVIRVGDDLEHGKLEDFKLGKQAYAGDVVERWMLVHKDGGALTFKTRSPVIVSMGRPHDKAKSASQTYNSGVVARGILAMEREDEHAVDRRQDHRDDAPMERRQRQRAPEREPLCVGKAQPIADANRRKRVDFANLVGAQSGVVWAKLLTKLGLDVVEPERLTVTQGKTAGATLDKWIAAKTPAEPAAEPPAEPPAESGTGDAHHGERDDPRGAP